MERCAHVAVLGLRHAPAGAAVAIALCNWPAAGKPRESDPIDLVQQLGARARPTAGERVPAFNGVDLRTRGHTSTYTY